MSRATHVASFVAGAAIATTIGAWAVPRASERDADRYRTLDTFAQTLHHVSSEYVDPVDEKKLLWDAAKGLMAGLDVHSTFLPPRRYQRVRQDTGGAFGGIGLTLGPGDADDAMPEARRWPIIDEVVPGSPADRAGLQLDDRIVEVDGKPTAPAGKDVAHAGVWEAKTRGASGTRVELMVLRVGWTAPRPFSMVREQVKMPSVQALAYQPRIGYLAISRFQDATHDDTKAALEGLRKAGAFEVVILDLRGNPGGLLDQGIRIADLFLDGGLIVTIHGRQGAIEKHVAHAAGTFTGPRLIVLVDPQTASSAEILAGALQDHKRATILGLPTYGKGSVQTFFNLDDGSGLKLTTARYYTPAGRSVEGAGIKPDISVDTFESETIVVAGGGEGGSAGGQAIGFPVEVDASATAGAAAGNDARIREALAEDNQFQVAYQTARGWLGSK